MSQAHWIAELRKVGFTGTDDRVAVVAGVLVANVLSSFRRMRFAGDPSSWLGADTLSAAEIQSWPAVLVEQNAAGRPGAGLVHVQLIRCAMLSVHVSYCVLNVYFKGGAAK